MRFTASGSDTSAIAATPFVCSTTSSTFSEGVAVVHRNARALGRQAQCDGAAKALAGAADECRLALEAHQITAPALGEIVWPAK